MRRPPEVRCNKALGVEGRRRALRTRNGVLPLEEDHPSLTGRLAARGFRCLAELRDEAGCYASGIRCLAPSLAPNVPVWVCLGRSG